MNKKEKLEAVAAGLRGYAKLETKRCSEVGHIAFKLGCGASAAKVLIAEVRAAEAAPIVDASTTKAEAKRALAKTSPAYALGRLRGRAALIHLHAAQEQLNAALRDLSSVTGAVPDYNVIRDLATRTKRIIETIRYEQLEGAVGTYHVDGASTPTGALTGAHACRCSDKDNMESSARGWRATRRCATCRARSRGQKTRP